MAASAQREFDLIVFGASGFTGQYVVEELAKVCEADPSLRLRWALAGRSRSKIQDVFNEKVLPRKSVSDGWTSPLVEADVADEASMVAMCSRCTVLLNCVGPYRFYGEKVVQACLAASTNYVDITGEPQFIESCTLKYHDAAASKGILIVPCCGFDSIPADIGALFMTSEFAKRNLTLSAIDSILSIQSGPKGSNGHFTTWECAVHGFGDQNALKRTRQELAKARPSKPYYGPRAAVRSLPHKEKRLNKWAFPFPGADASVVRLSQQFIAASETQPPVQYNAYFTVPDLKSALMVGFFGTIFKFMANWQFGRTLLLKFPNIFTWGFFSHAGPSEEQLRETSFRMDFFAKGYPKDTTVFTKENVVEMRGAVAGPEPGYVATPIFMVQAALTILHSKAALRFQGGVLTPGAAFFGSDIVERLRQRRIVFECYEERPRA